MPAKKIAEPGEAPGLASAAWVLHQWLGRPYRRLTRLDMAQRTG
jgi:hypothetical protein